MKFLLCLLLLPYTSLFTIDIFSLSLQAADDIGATPDSSSSSSFNPFLNTDPEPLLLILDNSPESPKPIHKVLDYFQKQNNTVI